MKTIDLNCDMGESFGLYRYGADQELIPLTSSANIACGFHGGDPSVMRQTVAAAHAHGLALGAHVGYPDLLGFGRRNLGVRPAELKDYVTYQLGALAAFAGALGARLHHVKPHGALYMTALDDEAISRAIVEAILEQDPGLMIYTIDGSATFRAAQKAGLRAVPEFFADRGYSARGKVKMFDWKIEEAGATPDAIGERICRLVLEGRVATFDGGDIPARAETVCVHSDTPEAPEIVRAIRNALKNANIEVKCA
jgi:UPF0271 protein